MFKFFESKLGRWVPLILVMGFGVLNYYTVWFGKSLHNNEIVWLKQIVTAITPYVFTGLAALAMFSLLYLIYVPIKATLQKILKEANVKPKVHIIIMRTFTLSYWGLIGFIAVSFIFSAFVSKVVVGAGVFGAAIALILQGLATDFVYGVLLQFGAKFQIGDRLTLSEIGYTPMSGTVVDIMLLSTVLDTPQGKIMLPNSQIWKQAITINNPVSGPVK